MTDNLIGSQPPGSIRDTSLLSPLSTLCLPPCPHPHIRALFLEFRAPSLVACLPHKTMSMRFTMEALQESKQPESA